MTTYGARHDVLTVPAPLINATPFGMWHITEISYTIPPHNTLKISEIKRGGVNMKQTSRKSLLIHQR